MVFQEQNGTYFLDFLGHSDMALDGIKRRRIGNGYTVVGVIKVTISKALVYSSCSW
jgi:hypothetical protein